MSQAETTLITPRRNFLIRAIGFGVAASASTLALAAPKPSLIITPDLAAKLAVWRDAYHTKEAAREALKNRERVSLDSRFDAAQPLREIYQRADDAMWEAHHAVCDAFF